MSDNLLTEQDLDAIGREFLNRGILLSESQMQDNEDNLKALFGFNNEEIRQRLELEKSMPKPMHYNPDGSTKTARQIRRQSKRRKK